MIDSILKNSLFFGVLISIATYELGSLLKSKCKSAVLKTIWNPLLISIAVIIGLLCALDIEYDTYYEGAQYLTYLLTPATVCLAVPLYEQLTALRKNLKAILAGIITGAITSASGVLVLSLLFGLTHEQYVTLLPKSITTAIGMGVSQELGGMVTITVAAIIITGVFGNMTAEVICRLFRIEEPIAKGVAIGSAAHAMGTAKAMEMGEVEGAMSSLSIAVSGLITVVLASVYAQFL